MWMCQAWHYDFFRGGYRFFFFNRFVHLKFCGRVWKPKWLVIERRFLMWENRRREGDSDVAIHWKVSYSLEIPKFMHTSVLFWWPIRDDFNWSSYEFPATDFKGEINTSSVGEWAGRLWCSVEGSGGCLEHPFVHGKVHSKAAKGHFFWTLFMWN